MSNPHGPPGRQGDAQDGDPPAGGRPPAAHARPRVREYGNRCTARPPWGERHRALDGGASPWDNAAMESLMGLVKAECVHARSFERGQAALEMFEYIECLSTTELRTHSALGYLSPRSSGEEPKAPPSRREGVNGIGVFRPRAASIHAASSGPVRGEPRHSAPVLRATCRPCRRTWRRCCGSGSASLAISARGTPGVHLAYIIDLIKGTVISSILSGRVRPKLLHLGKTIRRGPLILGLPPISWTQRSKFLCRRRDSDTTKACAG